MDIKVGINKISTNIKPITSMDMVDYQKNSFFVLKKTQLIIITTYLIFIFISEIYLREPIFDWSVNFLKIYHNNKSDSSFIILFCKFLGEIGNTPGYTLIIIISYIYFNVYRTGFLIFNLIICTFIIGTLKMIYANPRPYFESEEILSYSREGGWGNPSGHSLTAVCFILSFWKVIFQIQNLKDKESLKNWTFFGAILVILMILVSRFLIGAHSLNQIIFGALIGYALFYFYFYILDIDTEKPEQILKIIYLEENEKIYKKLYTLLVLNIFFIIIDLLFYFLNKDTKNELNFLNILNKRFTENPLKKYKMLQNEGLYSCSASLANICLFLGICFELNLTFKNNERNWIIYNFDYNENFLEFQSRKENVFKWNKINNKKRTIKFLIFLILLLITFLPFYFLGILFDNIYLILIIKLVIPVNIIFLGMFFFYKNIFRYFDVINHHDVNFEIVISDEINSVYYKQII